MITLFHLTLLPSSHSYLNDTWFTFALTAIMKITDITLCKDRRTRSPFFLSLFSKDRHLPFSLSPKFSPLPSSGSSDRLVVLFFISRGLNLALPLVSKDSLSGSSRFLGHFWVRLNSKTSLVQVRWASRSSFTVNLMSKNSHSHKMIHLFLSSASWMLSIIGEQTSL